MVPPIPCALPHPHPHPPAALSKAGVLCPPQVVAFCDVDENKIKKGFYCYEDSQVWRPLAPLGWGLGPAWVATPRLAHL